MDQSGYGPYYRPKSKNTKKQKMLQSVLKQHLKYNPRTGVFTWLDKSTKNVVAGQVAGTSVKNSRARISICNKRYCAHHLAWLYVYGEMPHCDVKHINGDVNDNRIANLRLIDEATPNEKKILACLPATSREIQNKTKLERQSINKILKRQIQAGTVQVTGKVEVIGSIDARVYGVVGALKVKKVMKPRNIPAPHHLMAMFGL